MTVELDHLILTVNNCARSIEFYGRVLGFEHEMDDGPFGMLRVSPGCVLLLSQGNTEGGRHLAFSMSRGEFEAMFARLKTLGIPYGDAYDQVGTMKGPGRESGARGMAETLYFFDPDKHLLEIRYYETK